MQQKTEPRRVRSLSFGIERLGLLALRYPVVVATILAAVTVAALFGITKLRVDDSLSELFRTDARTLRYRFTIEDPTTWTRPWTAEYTWPATDDLMYEYACHEGNYAMGNILRGARLKEADEAKKTKQQ